MSVALATIIALPLYYLLYLSDTNTQNIMMSSWLKTPIHPIGKLIIMLSNSSSKQGIFHNFLNYLKKCFKKSPENPNCSDANARIENEKPTQPANKKVAAFIAKLPRLITDEETTLVFSAAITTLSSTESANLPSPFKDLDENDILKTPSPSSGSNTSSPKLNPHHLWETLPPISSTDEQPFPKTALAAKNNIVA